MGWMIGNRVQILKSIIASLVSERFSKSKTRKCVAKRTKNSQFIVVANG